MCSRMLAFASATAGCICSAQRRLAASFAARELRHERHRDGQATRRRGGHEVAICGAGENAPGPFEARQRLCSITLRIRAMPALKNVKWERFCQAIVNGVAKQGQKFSQGRAYISA